MADRSQRVIYVDLASQRLVLRDGDECIIETAVSTGRNGAGELRDSERTPRGWHEVVEMIGTDCPANTVFVGRIPTGEIYTPELGAREKDRDWILTRILWLGGLEAGRNRDADVDTRSRYIYIHGSPDEAEMGRPGSRGCIRMHNRDILRLYDEVAVGTRVLIEE